MRGYYRKRGDAYQLSIYTGRDPVTGKKRYKYITMKAGEKAVQKRLRDELDKVEDLNYQEPANITLAEFLNKWLADYVKPQLAPRTYEGYESICRYHFIPRLGKIPLSKLRSEHLQKVYTDSIKAGLSGTTIRHHQAMIHRALQSAKKWHYISYNVADADNLELPKPNEFDIEPWDDFELKLFLEKARSEPYYSLCYTFLHTGLRRSEILALKVKDVDVLMGEISIHQAMHQLRDRSYVFRQNKSKKSRRTIALPPSCAIVLREHLERREAECTEYKIGYGPESLVFSQFDGRPLRPNTVTRAWQMLCQKCGVRVIRLHDARHTFASLMLKQGVDLKIVQEMLGHSRLSTTSDIYTHLLPGLQRSAARKFDLINNPDGQMDGQNFTITNPIPSN